MSAAEIIMLCAVSVVLIAGAAMMLITETANVKEWLLLAVTEAEKQYGSKTGKLKIRSVYENFIKLYPWFSKLVSFDTFSTWVDVVLKKMRDMIYTNKNIGLYVNGDKEGE